LVYKKKAIPLAGSEKDALFLGRVDRGIPRGVKKDERKKRGGRGEVLPEATRGTFLGISF